MPNTNSAVQWNIISKAKNGLYYLGHVGVEPGDTGATIFTKIQQSCLSSTKILSHSRLPLLHGPVVYLVTAVHGNLNDTEAQTCEVFIKSKRYSEAYTLAIRDPTRLTTATTPGSLVSRAHYGTNRKANQIVHGLLVVHEIRRAKVVIVFGALSIVSFGVGLAIGLMTGKAEIGISVTAGLFQFLTMLQWSYIWATRR